MAILEQIRTIDKKRLSKKLGRLTDSQMEEINQGLLISLGYTRAKPKALEVCLCHRCMGYFYDTSKYIVRRKNPYQEIKGDCTYCNYGKGYDYLITLKARR
jgi:mRNA interferase MazF